MKYNFKEFIWDKQGDNKYSVTDIRTGNEFYITPRLEKGKFSIDGEYDDRGYPKIYNKFQVMDYIINRR
jgi:hypothetical protein